MIESALASVLGDMSAEVAQEVGRFLVDERPDELTQRTKSSATDIVTQMDAMAEEMARSLIFERRPHDGFLGEEGSNDHASSGLTWVVDPIDGTTNYVYGLPMWAVSVAVMHEGRSIAGCVCAPGLNMTAVAVRGAGAVLRHDGSDEVLHASRQHDLAHSLIGTGFGYSVGRRASQGRVVADVLSRVRDIRRSGAASIDLCWVAAGLLDGYYEHGLHLWDFAAGALLIEESGGTVTTLDGKSVWAPMTQVDGSADPSQEWNTIVAAAPGLHVNLRDLLISVTAGEYV